jgi:hypothetical protein
MRVAFIVSRNRTDRDAIEAAVGELPPDTTIIIGGALSGPDTWIEEAARLRGLEVLIFRPNLIAVQDLDDATERYYERNQQIVDAADRMIAFVAPDRTGATEDTIRRAAARGIPIGLR